MVPGMNIAVYEMAGVSFRSFRTSGNLEKHKNKEPVSGAYDFDRKQLSSR